MATAISHDPVQRSGPRGLGGRRRVPLAVWVLACIGAALLTAYRLFILLEPPGVAIRGELRAAASEMRTQLVLEPGPRVVAAMRRDFAGRDVSIATSPASSILVVTLHDLDRGTCVDAVAKARRIDGQVVVLLQGYGSPEDCGSRNEMTWRIMP